MTKEGKIQKAGGGGGGGSLTFTVYKRSFEFCVESQLTVLLAFLTR